MTLWQEQAVFLGLPSRLISHGHRTPATQRPCTHAGVGCPRATLTKTQTKTMARLSRTSVLLLLAASLLALCPGGANAGIGLLNSCPFPVSAFARSGSDPTYSYSLAAGGGYQFLDFGACWLSEACHTLTNECVATSMGVK